ncbi:MAG TPA: SAF domain-containing protein [Jatrophihabitans sp.]|jgi:Flp pilus assembly protein CpaB|nr:SAF domain-containing protein [Jatrophihabitans sp.]
MLAPFRSRLSGRLSVLAGWPRRVAALLCLALAVLSALTSHGTSAQGHRSPVIVTVKPLRPGTVLAAADLAAVLWPDPMVPAAAIARLSDVLGHTVAAAMTRGEPLTAARLLDTGMTAALEPGQVALTIGLAGGNQAAILQAGALVDLYAAGTDAALIEGSPLPSGGTGHRLGTSLRVLAVLPATTDPVAGSGGPSLVIAADRATAARLADRPAGQFLASLVPP